MKNKTTTYRNKKQYKEIKKDLLEALRNAGKCGAHEKDMVDSYMDLWCHFQMLKDDVSERGVFVTYDNGGGQKGTKRNESLQDELKVSAQMLKIREAMGIKDIASDGGEDDEL